jgi:hypothetical protein
MFAKQVGARLVAAGDEPQLRYLLTTLTMGDRAAKLVSIDRFIGSGAA